MLRISGCSQNQHKAEKPCSANGNKASKQGVLRCRNHSELVLQETAEGINVGTRVPGGCRWTQWAPGMSASDRHTVDYMDPGWLPGWRARVTAHNSKCQTLQSEVRLMANTPMYGRSLDHGKRTKQITIGERILNSGGSQNLPSHRIVTRMMCCAVYTKWREDWSSSVTLYSVSP